MKSCKPNCPICHNPNPLTGKPQRNTGVPAGHRIDVLDLVYGDIRKVPMPPPEPKPGRKQWERGGPKVTAFPRTAPKTDVEADNRAFIEEQIGKPAPWGLLEREAKLKELRRAVKDWQT